MDNNTAPYFPVYEWDNIVTKEYRVFSEHLPKGASIGTIFAEDAENDNLVYSITGGAHQDFFGIFQDILELGDFVMKTNHIYLKDFGQFDFEVLKSSNDVLTDIFFEQDDFLSQYLFNRGNPEEFVILDLEVSVSDGNLTTSKIINPALYEMTLYANNDYTVTENDVGGYVARVPREFYIANDNQYDLLTYSILSGQDGEIFEIDNDIIKFKEDISADYEQDQNLNFTLRATNHEDLHVDQVFTIKVLNDPNDDSSNLPPSNDLFQYYSSLEDSIIPDVTKWDTSSVTNMQYAFASAVSFNQDISNWDTSSVTKMSGMFTDAYSFNQDISSWDTSSVYALSGTFWYATDFNQDISSWDVSSVEYIGYMFANTSSFNQDIGNWNTSAVINMDSMFYKADAFDQDLSGLEIQNVTNMNNMLSGSGLSIANYDATLNGWYQQALTTGVQNDVNLGAEDLTYSVASSAARQALIDDYGWRILGDSLIEATATFTASIDKWQSDGMGDWIDGPSMKLHRKDIADEVGIDLTAKDGHPGHKHKPDMDKGSYELRVEHNQQTDGAIDIDDVMGVLSLSRGKSSPASKEHKLAADWNGDGIIDIDDVMGVLARSRGKSKEDEWRFHDKTSDTSLWDNATKTNKMDIELDGDNEIELSAILRGDLNSSYDAVIHNRAPEATPAPNPAPLPLNNDDELLTINLDIV